MQYKMVELIQKKRDGFALDEQEIRHIIEGYTNGAIPDYQMSAFSMAIYFQGMSEEETAYLTKAMAESGTQIDLSDIPGVKVDKHSTGGVGDTTTLVLAPLVASCGVPVAKMSGRGLGHTGGTIDKLESIAGFQVELSKQTFIEQVKSLGIAITSQSQEIAPADKKLYALRDVTATVDSIPLIASSVMSKKIASGADAIVLDVKTGSGAFMKDEKDAAQLAETMVKIGSHVNRNTIAIISSMEQPLGYAIGNAMEVREAIETLQGKGPEDLHQLSIILGAQMLVAGNVAADENEAQSMLENHIESGKALEVFRRWIRAQGGDDTVADDVDRLPQASYKIEVKSRTSGTVSQIDAERIGRAAMRLGAGRETKEASIDLTAGLVLQKKIGDCVAQNETIAVLHTNDEQIANHPQAIITEVQNSYQFSASHVERPAIIKAIVTDEGTRWL